MKGNGKKQVCLSCDLLKGDRMMGTEEGFAVCKVSGLFRSAWDLSCDKYTPKPLKKQENS